MTPRPPPPLPLALDAARLSEGLRAAVDFLEQLEDDGALARLAEGLVPLVAARLELTLQPAALLGALVQSPGLAALEPFCGDWVGRWGDDPVHQRWAPAVAAPPGCAAAGVSLQRLQYAWVGDGFGYNLEVTRGGDRLLLGAVFHLEPAPGEVVAYLTPHVGIAAAISRVVWLTPQHVFFERVDPAPACYSIVQYGWSQQGATLDLTWSYETAYHRPADQNASP